MKKTLTNFIRAISEPTRFQIISLLKHDRCVCELWRELNLPQNLVSHHLKILKRAGLISSKKQGVKVIYHLNKNLLKKRLDLLNKFLI